MKKPRQREKLNAMTGGSATRSLSDLSFIIFSEVIFLTWHLTFFRDDNEGML